MFQPIISTFYVYQILILIQSTSSNDNDLTIPGYDLYRANHSSHVKSGEFVSTVKFSSVESNRHSISTRVHQLRNANQGKIM